MAKKVLQILAIAVLSLSLLGCTAPAPTDDSSSEDGTIKIGAIHPLTGDGVAYGDPLSTVAKIALDKVNAEGGINGKTLEIIWEDGKCNGKDAATAAQKLINIDKVDVIYGGLCSSETLGIAPIAEAAKVVVFSAASSSPDITNAGDYIFRNYPSDTTQGKILAEVAKELGLKKVATLTEENDYTIGIEESFKAAFDGEIVAENFLPTDTDFKTQIVKLKGASPDALFINPQTVPKAELILKQLQEQGKGEMRLFINDIMQGAGNLTKNYGELVEGAVGAEAAYEADNPDFVAMTEKYKELKGEEVPFKAYAATAYDAIILLSEAFKQGKMGGDDLKNFLYDVKEWPGTAGKLTIDENGDPVAGHKPIMIKDGETVPYSAE